MPHIMVSGIVKDDTGKGVSGALVAVKTGPGRPDISALSGAGGSYSLSLWLPGDYVLEATKTDGRRRSGTLSVYVPESGKRDADIVIR